MKLRLLCLLSLCAVPAALCSCRTNAHIPVPGERSTIQKSIYTEYLAIADAYNDLEKYDKAIEYYKYASKNRSLYWNARYKMARAYALSKDWTSARKIYMELLKRDPENLNIKLSLAYITAMEGNVDSAAEIYRLLRQDNPEQADILVNYINVVIAQEKYDDAAALVKELKEQFSDNTNIASFEKKLEEVEAEKRAAEAGGADADESEDEFPDSDM
nr:tetratricopeptide repeat protein [Treponemataceae bacterium]